MRKNTPNAVKGSVSDVLMPARAGVASGAPMRPALIPCSDDLFVLLPIRSSNNTGARLVVASDTISLWQARS
jgi:hypothetical protein